MTWFDLQCRFRLEHTGNAGAVTAVFDDQRVDHGLVGGRFTSSAIYQWVPPVL